MPLPAGVAGHPALTFTTPAVAEIMTACFEGYVVPQAINGDMFNARFRRESLDLRASRVFMEGERPVALILVARRGWTARIAGMGMAALGEVIDDLRRLGDQCLLLEVIDTNEPAIRLYSSFGFETLRRLIGYRRPADAETPSTVTDVTEVDPLTVARTVAQEGTADLPWFLAPETLAAAAAPARGLSLAGEAFAIVESAPQPTTLALRTLVVNRNARGRGLGRANDRCAWWEPRAWHDFEMRGWIASNSDVRRTCGERDGASRV